MTHDHRLLGSTIQEKRQQKGCTQDELSDIAGLSYSTLAKIERGAVQNPSVFTISSIAQALGCSTDDLLLNQDTQPNNQSAPAKADTFLYCDLNGVLVRFFHRAFSTIAEENNVSMDKVEAAFWHYNDAANRGELSIDQFNLAMADHLNIKELDWHERYLSSVEPIESMHNCLRELIKTHRIGILSNIHQGLIPKLIQRGLIPDIDYACIVDSSEVHAIKPEQRMYEIAEKAANAKGCDILFIDDSRANLIAAERLGWRVMWFDDYRPEDSVARLKEALAASK